MRANGFLKVSVPSGAGGFTQPLFVPEHLIATLCKRFMQPLRDFEGVTRAVGQEDSFGALRHAASLTLRVSEDEWTTWDNIKVAQTPLAASDLRYSIKLQY